jgi:hypothetical protein
MRATEATTRKNCISDSPTASAERLCAEPWAQPGIGGHFDCSTSHASVESRDVNEPVFWIARTMGRP